MKTLLIVLFGAVGLQVMSYCYGTMFEIWEVTGDPVILWMRWFDRSFESTLYHPSTLAQHFRFLCESSPYFIFFPLRVRLTPPPSMACGGG